MVDAEHVGLALAYALLAGPWTAEAMRARALEALGPEHRKLAARVVKHVLERSPLPLHGRERALTDLIARCPAVERAVKAPSRVRIERWFVPALSGARPLPGLTGLGIPILLSVHDVAALTGLEADALAWYADPHRFNRTARPARLRHYHYRWLRKRSGAYRLIEAPKPRLKLAQRRILDGILSKVPLHDACHGHRRGRSLRSYVQLHCGRALVLKLDLREFFNLITEARVRATFASLGYSDAIAALLAGLCCAPTPEEVLATRPRPTDGGQVDARFAQRALLRNSHLPQGAPSSPALANLAAYRLDLRLSALAARFEARYTRYADDLAFSGEARFQRAEPWFADWVTRIAAAEGFAVRPEKTRAMPREQRQALCGVVLNEEAALPREKLEQLEAILFNCVRSGPAAQNRARHVDFRAHLAGRVEWASHVNARRAGRLRALFDSIDWS